MPRKAPVFRGNPLQSASWNVQVTPEFLPWYSKCLYLTITYRTGRTVPSFWNYHYSGIWGGRKKRNSWQVGMLWPTGAQRWWQHSPQRGILEMCWRWFYLVPWGVLWALLTFKGRNQGCQTDGAVHTVEHGLPIWSHEWKPHFGEPRVHLILHTNTFLLSCNIYCIFQECK